MDDDVSNIRNSIKNLIENDGVIKWPPNDGFLGTPREAILEPGVRIDRFGKPIGNFAAPEGTPIPMRSLAPGSKFEPYNVYKVAKPINVLRGRTAPWFGQPGGGIQYKFPQTIEYLLNKKYLIKIPR